MAARLNVSATTSSPMPATVHPPLETQSALLVWTVDPELRPSWSVRPRALHGLATKIDRLLEGGDDNSPAVAAHRRALKGRSADVQMEWSGRSFHLRLEAVRGDEETITAVLGLALQDSRRSSLSRRRAEQRLLEARLRDDLTKLPNRVSFIERLREATAPNGWSREGLFLLLMDLDRFREVNEALGYPAGDRLLVETAARLNRRLRPGDVLARFGADEFAVLLAGVKTGEDAMRVSQRLLREMENPIDVDGRPVQATLSVGIAVGSRAGQKPEQILRDAERALARAKLFGPAGARPSDAVMDARGRVLQQLETVLHRAVDCDEFRAHYQPVVSRKGGNLLGFEVLLWRKQRRAPAAPTGSPATPAPDAVGGQHAVREIAGEAEGVAVVERGG